MLQLLRKKIIATRQRKFAVSTMAGILFLVGLCLLYNALKPINIPDLQYASTQQITNFLINDYNRISIAHQKQFTRDVAKWYLKANRQDQKTFEQSWKNAKMPKNIKSHITAQLRIASAHQVSSHYANLKPEDKKQYLAQINFMVNTLPIGKKLQELLAGDQWNTVIKNPIKYRKKMDN